MCLIFFLYYKKSVFIEWEIFILNCSRVTISLIIDWISLTFLSFVRLISGVIIGYSIYYIAGDRNYLRFVFILLLFISSIIFLIISPNLISLLLGWDGLGLTSYALVIYYQREASLNSGIITVLSNRVGDATLLIVVGSCLIIRRWNFLFYQNFDKFFIFLIIITAITKSAQIPFSAWLPAAMAAPTPVSALVHSSTLVTAGVYLLIRFSNLIILNNINYIIFYVGVLTIFISGLVANFERDLKKVVALSTLSQLGLIFIVLGVSQPILAFFHLIIHALFKSALFICAGFIIHNLHGSQDGRQGGLFRFNSPFLGVIFSVTNIALCGFPFIAGFYSKDAVLESVFRGSFGVFLILLVVLSTGFTISYRLRVIYISIGNKGKTLSVIVRSDFSLLLILRIFVLYLLRIVGGFIFRWLFIAKGFVFSISFIEKFYVLIICFFSFFFIKNIISLKYYNKSIIKNNLFFKIMFFMPLLTSQPLSNLFLYFGKKRLKRLDKGWFEFSGPYGIKNFIEKSSNYTQQSQILIFSNHYFFSFFLIIFVLLYYMCLRSSKSTALKVQACINTLNKQEFSFFGPKPKVLIIYTTVYVSKQCYLCLERTICFLHYKNNWRSQ